MALQFKKPTQNVATTPAVTRTPQSLVRNSLPTGIPGIPGMPTYGLPSQNKQLMKINPPMEGLPRAATFFADRTGCSYWRLHMPSSMMNYSNQAVIDQLTKMVPSPHFYVGYNTVIVQRQMTIEQIQFIEFLHSVRQKIAQMGQKPFKIIYEIDDICVKKDIPEYNACKTAYQDESLFQNMKKIVHLCDEMLVPTEFMRDYYRRELEFEKVTVVPNYSSRDWFDGLYNKDKTLELFEKNKKKPRILYAGSSTHFDVLNLHKGQDDFAAIVDVIKKTVNKYQWVFFGGVPPSLQSLVTQGKIESHPWVHITQYPKKLSELNCQLTIAPLVHNNFNKAKAFIKFSESCHIGLPFVGQKLNPYKDSFHQFDTADEMMYHIEDILNGDYEAHSKKHREFGDTLWLDDHLSEFYLTYFTDYEDPKRKENPTFAKLNNLI